ncbi:hypothetical protein [Spirillospora sp. CA-294931]|uniref:hypothetical protein n=1 Tax=Spirillospora sp. CA-294931 TaxID=3240042 RepID=UPI003D8A0E77
MVRKPGALHGARVLEQARAAGKFTPVHDSRWAEPRTAHGDAEGTRALIQVLLLARHMDHEHIVTGVATALRVGALTADTVALEARKAADADREAPGQVDPEALAGAPAKADKDTPEADSATVTSLTERRLRLAPTPARHPAVALAEV